MAKKQKNKGVTLIELLIVVLILAALAAIAVPRISQSAATAKARACETNINMFNSMIEQYFIDNGDYPNDMDVLFNDTSYFPDGKPVCPITGETYKKDMTGDDRYKADGHNH